MSALLIELGAVITEDEMIAEFLRAEVESELHGPRLRSDAAMLAVDLATVRQPDCASAHENESRRALLVACRGWGAEESVFGALPTDTITWWRAALDRRSVDHVEVIQWLVDEVPEAFPVRPLGGIRHARVSEHGPRPDAAARLADALARGQRPARPILITTPAIDRLVILEGHNRMVAYALLGEDAPPLIDVIMGVTAEADAWEEW
jgi:hypothetical protein